MDRLFFDIESTGNNVVKDRIIDLAIKIVAEDGTVKLNKSRRYNPGIPIDPAATAVNGIKDEDVKDCPAFKDDAKKLKKLFEDKVIITYNGEAFDIPLLLAEFDRAGVQIKLSDKRIDVLKLERKINSHTLSETYKRYTGKEFKGAHNANADVDATEIVLSYHEKLLKPEDIYEEVRSIADFSGKLKHNAEGYLIFNFGKNKDKRIIDEPDYATWVLKNDTFSEMVKKLIREEQSKYAVSKTSFKTKSKGIDFHAAAARIRAAKQTEMWEPVNTGDDDLPF